jgi:hypothetical protein
MPLFCHVSRISVAHRIKHSDTVPHSCFSIGDKPVWRAGIERSVDNALPPLVPTLPQAGSKGSWLFLKSTEGIVELIAEILLRWRTVRLMPPSQFDVA